MFLNSLHVTVTDSRLALSRSLALTVHNHQLVIHGAVSRSPVPQYGGGLRASTSVLLIIEQREQAVRTASAHATVNPANAPPHKAFNVNRREDKRKEGPHECTNDGRVWVSFSFSLDLT